MGSGCGCGCGLWIWLTLHGNDEATFTLNHLRDHVVDKSMFIPDTLGIKVLLILRLEDLLEDILKPPVVFLEDGILGAHVQGHFF